MTLFILITLLNRNGQTSIITWNYSWLSFQNFQWNHEMDSPKRRKQFTWMFTHNCVHFSASNFLVNKPQPLQLGHPLLSHYQTRLQLNPQVNKTTGSIILDKGLPKFASFEYENSKLGIFISFLLKAIAICM